MTKELIETIREENRYFDVYEEIIPTNVVVYTDDEGETHEVQNHQVNNPRVEISLNEFVRRYNEKVNELEAKKKLRLELNEKIATLDEQLDEVVENLTDLVADLENFEEDLDEQYVKEWTVDEDEEEDGE